MITIRHSGDFDKTMKFLETMKKKDATAILNRYGEQGVSLLSAATPKKTGKTAASWSYDVSRSNGRYVLSWNNSNINDGVNVALIIQYGHGTKRGTYVKGIDYINPVLEKVFKEMADELWKEVVNA